MKTTRTDDTRLRNRKGQYSAECKFCYCPDGCACEGDCYCGDMKPEAEALRRKQVIQRTAARLAAEVFAKK